MLTGRPTPSCVDDVATAVQRAIGLRRASLAPLAAAGAAGPVVELRHCRGAFAAEGSRAEVAFLAKMQLRAQAGT
eukprot:12421152-Alexandrium_andersonii.AAC.1